MFLGIEIGCCILSVLLTLGRESYTTAYLLFIFSFPVFLLACYSFKARSWFSCLAAFKAAAFAAEDCAFSNNEGLAFDIAINLSVAGELQFFLAGDVAGNLTVNSCVFSIYSCTDVAGFTDEQVVVDS